MAIFSQAQPASALGVSACIDKYGSDLAYESTAEDVKSMKDDGCEAPVGPCRAIQEFTPSGEEERYTITCDSRFVEDGGDETPKLTDRQCIEKYHKELNPTPSKLDKMRENGCRKPDGPCEEVRIPFHAIDCKGELTVDPGGDPSDDPGGSSACDVKTSIIPVNCSSGANPIWGLLLMAINILTAGIGIVAIGGIIYAAILWTTAEDKNAQIVKSKETIFNVILGLAAYALLFAFIQFLVPGGVFNREIDLSSPPPSSATPDAPDSGSGKDDEKDGDVTAADIRLLNFRDATTATGGNVLKKGVLYRSASLSGLNDKNAKKLAKLLGSGAIIIDIRSDRQRNEKPDKPVDGVHHVNIPITGILDTEPMVTDPLRRSQLAKALKTAANARGAVLVHCAAGKDRTGWMVAMIMYVSGANDAQVMKEYLKSNDAIPGGVKAEWLKSGLQEARSKHGSIENYLKSIGLSSDDLKNLKNKFGA